MAFVVLGVQFVFLHLIFWWNFFLLQVTILVGVYSFKLHNMVADKKKSNHIGQIVWSTRFSLCSGIFFGPPPYYAVWNHKHLLGSFVQTMLKLCCHKWIRSCWLRPVLAIKNCKDKRLTKISTIVVWIFNYYNTEWLGCKLIPLWRALWKSIKPFMYLNRTPVSSGLLPFGVGCPGDIGDQGVTLLAFLAQIFTEKLIWQNWRGKQIRLHIGKIVRKVWLKKFPLAFYFHDFFD